MNRISKKVGLAMAGLALSLPLIAVVPSLSAATDSSTKESAFCTNLPSLISKVNADMSNLENKLSTARSQRDQQLAANQTKWDQELATDRAMWAQKRQGQFTELEAKATTDAEKAAVQTYETTITNAINTRESANDAARAAFRSGLTDLLSSRRSGVDGQVATFTNSVNSAEAAATASCQSTPTQGATIRTTFQAAMKAARQAFVNDRKGDSGIGDQVKQLAATRNAAVKANDAAFQTTAKAAADALKAVFKSTSV